MSVAEHDDQPLELEQDPVVRQTRDPLVQHCGGGVERRREGGPVGAGVHAFRLFDQVRQVVAPALVAVELAVRRAGDAYESRVIAQRLERRVGRDFGPLLPPGGERALEPVHRGVRLAQVRVQARELIRDPGPVAIAVLERPAVRGDRRGRPVQTVADPAETEPEQAVARVAVDELRE